MSVDERLAKIESLLRLLVEGQPARRWYTTKQAADLLGKAAFTVRNWCRGGRLKANKRESGRVHREWSISNEELLRYQREGLLSPSAVVKSVEREERR
jgi:predicted site-specific integrase-resolvase